MEIHEDVFHEKPNNLAQIKESYLGQSECISKDYLTGVFYGSSLRMILSVPCKTVTSEV
jgi:hypothetical protein